MGRTPSKDAEAHISATISKDLKQQCDDYISKAHINSSQLIRNSLEEYFIGNDKGRELKVLAKLVHLKEDLGYDTIVVDDSINFILGDIARGDRMNEETLKHVRDVVDKSVKTQMEFVSIINMYIKEKEWDNEL